MRTPAVMGLVVWLGALTLSSACQRAYTSDGPRPGSSDSGTPFSSGAASPPSRPRAGAASPPVDLTHAVVPIVPGLTIVTAIEDLGDDYESFKVVLESDPQRYRFSYSSLFKSEQQLKSSRSEREVSTADHVNAAQYRIAFSNGDRGPAPGTTAISLSTAKFRELVSKGQTRLDIVTLQGDFDGNPSPVPQSVDLKQDGRIDFPVLINNRMTRLPAIHALYRMNFDPAIYPNAGVQEFLEGFTFLDDEVNPLALRWQYSLWSLEVIRINNVRLKQDDAHPPAGSDAPSKNAPAPDLAQELESGLAGPGTVEVPGIYFDTGSASIRPESGPAIAAIAETLSKNATLKVSIEGHTDNQGGEQNNLDLSRTRAAAVRAVLIEKYKIDAGRMTTRGHGYGKPRADNSTLLGRAQNRRVELVRL